MKLVFTMTAILATTATVVFAADLVTLHPGNYAEFVPAGKAADAFHGDYALRNDKIAVVVGDPALMRGRSASRKAIVSPGGRVIDLTRRDQPNDLLDAYAPMFKSTESRDNLTAAGDPGEPTFQSHFVESAEAYLMAGRQPKQGKRVVLTIPMLAPGKEVRYILEDGWDYLLVEVEFRHEGKDPLKIRPSSVLTLGPASITGGAALVGGLSELSTTWVYDPWFGQAYAVQAADHQAVATSVVGRENWLMQTAAGEGAVHNLAGGQSLVMTKRLIPGADSFSVMATAVRIAGKPLAPLTLTLRSTAGPEADVLVKAYRGKDLYAAGRTNAKGELVTHMPPGKYRFTAQPLGRADQSVELEVAAAGAGEMVFAPPATVSVEVVDDKNQAVPCKVEFLGLGSTPDPYFFPETGAEQVRNLRYSITGKFTQVLPPGDYEVWISHGPEYDLAIRKLTLAEGKSERLAATLARKLDTRGWISADLGNRSAMSSTRSLAEPVGRVLNLVAEQIEFAPATEDDHIYSYEPFIKAMGAQKLLATCPGIHLTQRVRMSYTRQNSFPVIYKPGYQDGGAWQRPQHLFQVQWLNGWYGQMPASGRSPYRPGNEKLIQVTPPGIWVGDGTWHGMWFLFSTAEMPHAMRSFDDVGRNNALNEVRLYDAMELQPLQDFLQLSPFDAGDPDGAKDQAAWQLEMSEWSRTKNWPVLEKPHLWWLRILNQGWRITGVVNSNAYSNFHGSGAWRNYIQVGKDDPATLDPLDVVRAIKAGKVVMSSGPFMEVTLRAAGDAIEKAVGPGGDLKAPGGKATLHVKVQSAAGTTMDQVQVLFNGRPVPELTRSRAKHPADFRNDTVQFDADLPVEMKVDTRVIVLASGSGSNVRGVLAPQKTPAKRGDAPPPRELLSSLTHVAMSNPIYVDVNSDGFKPHPPWMDRVFARIYITAPLLSAAAAPPAKLRIRIKNIGTEPASDSFRFEVRPDDAATIVGDNLFSYQLAPGEMKDFEAVVKLKPGVKAEQVRIGVPRSTANTGRRGCGISIRVDDKTISNTTPSASDEGDWWLPEQNKDAPGSWMWPEFGRPAKP